MSESISSLVVEETTEDLIYQLINCYLHVFCKQKVQRVAAKNTKACSSFNFYLFIVAAATFTEESAFCNR